MNRRHLFRALAATALLTVAQTTRLGEVAAALIATRYQITDRIMSYDEIQDRTWIRYAAEIDGDGEWHGLAARAGRHADDGDFAAASDAWFAHVIDLRCGARV